jgi:hypothetical protein
MDIVARKTGSPREEMLLRRKQVSSASSLITVPKRKKASPIFLFHVYTNWVFKPIRLRPIFEYPFNSQCKSPKMEKREKQKHLNEQIKYVLLLKELFKAIFEEIHSEDELDEVKEKIPGTLDTISLMEENIQEEFNSVQAQVPLYLLAELREIVVQTREKYSL